jgi:hypothetical protein
MSPTVLLLAMWCAVHGVPGFLAREPGTNQAPASAERVSEVSDLQFHSAFWMNLHHVLYAAAWAGRPEAGTLRALAGVLPEPLSAPLSAEERHAWDASVEFYDREMAGRDLLFDRGMMRIKTALAAGDLASQAVDRDLREALERAAPVYRRHYWPAHDRANRVWIEATAGSLRSIAGDVIPRLEQLYGEKWFASPVRVDVVWVGNRQGGYTSNNPTHVTVSSGDPEHKGWTSVEIVLHEVSHTLVLPLQKSLADALGDRLQAHGILWHVIQFYLTGAAVQQVLRARGIEYSPYLYSTGLFDRAWARYRQPVEENWEPYVKGTITRERAIQGTLAAVTAR